MNDFFELGTILEESRKQFDETPKGDEDIKPGEILNCDNLDYLSKHYNSQTKIDFIYIDPPFFSKADYKARIKRDGKIIKTLAYSDKWDSLSGFLQSLFIRLLFMKNILSDSGLLAVHLDTHAVHYVKVMIDQIFGEKNFVNEIIWSYKSGGASNRSFAKKHDTILLYSKTPDYFFSPQKEVSYNRNGRPYKFHGVSEFQDEDGHWYTLINQRDVISIDMVGRTSSERTGYATQKPEKLLELLISSCCPKNGLCADFFCGSGSLGAAAKKLDRQFVLCDQSPLAIEITKDRLK